MRGPLPAALAAGPAHVNDVSSSFLGGFVCQMALAQGTGHTGTTWSLSIVLTQVQTLTLQHANDILEMYTSTAPGLLVFIVIDRGQEQMYGNNVLIYRKVALEETLRPHCSGTGGSQCEVDQQNTWPMRTSAAGVRPGVLGSNGAAVQILR